MDRLPVIVLDLGIQQLLSVPNPKVISGQVFRQLLLSLTKPRPTPDHVMVRVPFGTNIWKILALVGVCSPHPQNFDGSYCLPAISGSEILIFKRLSTDLTDEVMKYNPVTDSDIVCNYRIIFCTKLLQIFQPI